jgi:thioredoxin reductase (NADPH)
MEDPMPKPAILMVDDDELVLNAVERDLRLHFRDQYRLIKAGSGGEALALLQQLKQRNTPLALFLVDQRMPELTGTKFLDQAIRFYPQARRVLLTAYADTEAAILSINKLGLDYYLLKPWDPPEQHLYPILDDLLSEWQATVQLPYDGLRVVGAQWSPSSHQVKDFLSRNRIPYRWQDIEQDAEARLVVDGLLKGQRRLPVVFLPDGSDLIEPDSHTLAARIGLHTQASQPYYDLIIIGAGPAGLGAAVYGASEGFRTALIEREATGGQAGTSSKIENYLGFPLGISGLDLARRATDQARRLGAEILTTQEVINLRVEDSYRIVTLQDGTELSCKALVIASGVTVRKLDAPGIEKLTGAGIYYGAAVTEAAYYQDQPVFVVGGANSAGQGALLLSQHASQVTMLVRSSSLSAGMSQYLIDQIAATPTIKVLTQVEVVAAHGETRLEAVSYQNKVSAETLTIPGAAMFIFVGAVPHTAMVAGIVQCNRSGFILTGADLMREGKPPAGWPLRRDPYLLETSVPGIFAAGDVRQGAVRRVASAVGEGAVVVSLVHQYLKTV